MATFLISPYQESYERTPLLLFRYKKLHWCAGSVLERLEHGSSISYSCRRSGNNQHVRSSAYPFLPSRRLYKPPHRVNNSLDVGFPALVNVVLLTSRSSRSGIRGRGCVIHLT